MTYAYVEKNEVCEVHYFKPKNWRNISNFDSLSSDELLNMGWYEVIDVIPEYDQTKYEVIDMKIIYEDNQVKRVPVFKEIIVEEQSIDQNAVS